MSEEVGHALTVKENDMKKSTLRRADMVFSLVLMGISVWTMIESVKLLFNPFGRDFSKVRGDDIKANIETWYQSAGLVPFIIACFLLICALFLFHFARREGARFDFIKLGKIESLLKNEEFRVAVAITAILSVYVFVLMPLCRSWLDFFPRFQGFPFLVATFIMLFAMMVIFGEKKPKNIVISLIISAAAATAIAYGFGMLALIPLP